MNKLANSFKQQEILLWLFAIVVAVCAGAIATTGELKYMGLFLGGFAGLLIAMFPVALFWLAIIVSIVVSGLVQLYYPQLQLVRWAIVPITMALVVHTLIQFLRDGSVGNNDTSAPLIIWLAFGFILVNIFSSLINYQDVSSAITGFKGYFQVWGLLFAMAFIKWDRGLMETKLPKVIFYIALIQVPFTLHQYFFIAPARVGLVRGLVPIDIVSGTFGASFEGGGANAALAAFMFVVWSCVIALWKNKLIPTTHALIISGIILSPVMINEAKVSVIYVVVVFLVVFRRGSFQNMARFLGIGFVTIGIVAAMFFAYVSHAPEGKVSSWSDLIAYTYEYNVAKDDAWGGKLSRGGAMKLWMEEHGSVINTMFGYGVGVTRSDETNALSRKLGINTTASFGIGPIAAVAILWESGVIGFLLIVALFAVAYLNAGKLEKRYKENLWLSSLFLGLQGAIVVLFISIWHKSFFVFHVGFQAVPVLIFGFLAYWLRQSSLEAANEKN